MARSVRAAARSVDPVQAIARDTLSHIANHPESANDPALRLWAPVRARQCDCCGYIGRQHEPRFIGAYEPAGPLTRLIYTLCIDCTRRLPGDLELAASLQRRLTCRCPEAMLSGLVATLEADRRRAALQ